ncbi:MAG: ribosome silencing factor [Oscillospiraceae bacterium]|nr:ribosome silencing factor [Oscillospiraceae bacterium]
MTGLELARAIAKTLDDKLGVDVRVLKVEDLTIIADYFVIVSGESSTQVRALAEETEHRLEALGIRPVKMEGEPKGGWVLMDYNTVLLHIFHSEAREFYSLERLWADAEPIEI